MLRDLQPYSCLDMDCPKQDEAFVSRNAWVKHLESDHGLHAQSSSRQCQLCQQWTGKGLREICKHFADHLEDVAIAALGHHMTSEAGSETDSTNSQGAALDQRTLESANEGSDAQTESRVVEPISTAMPPPPKPVQGENPPQVNPNQNMLDAAPNCAFCNAPPDPECPCESERLQIAVTQAERRRIDPMLVPMRYVILIYLSTTC